ncbi:hypothetical protein RT27_24215, partial [Bacillus sp. L_1B0_5]
MGKKRRYLKKRNLENQDGYLLGKKSDIPLYQYKIPKIFKGYIDVNKRIQEQYKPKTNPFSTSKAI